MNRTFRFRFDRRTLYISALHVVLYLAIGVGLYLLYEGGYFSAWFASFVGALLVLMSLSIPRTLLLTDEQLEVRCLLDITELPYQEIASVRMVEPEEMRWVFPYFGAFGFFGYYGHFFDFKQFERIKIYASEWRNMVEVMTIYEERYWISCSEAEELIRLIDEVASQEA